MHFPYYIINLHFAQR